MNDETTTSTESSAASFGAPKAENAAHTPGPWDYVPSNEHHGPYVTSNFGGTICDCYVMSEPGAFSVRNGGPSKPILFFHEMADPNARLIAAAPDMLAALQSVMNEWRSGYGLGCEKQVRAAITKATQP